MVPYFPIWRKEAHTASGLCSFLRCFTDKYRSNQLIAMSATLLNISDLDFVALGANLNTNFSGKKLTMAASRVSQTAEYMAFFRALESYRPVQKRLFYDPFARHFLGSSLGRWFLLSRVPLLGSSLVYQYVDRRLLGARTSAVARTRFIDDEWVKALHDSIRQFVILGAGFDCRAYRILEEKEHHSSPRVFEVDQAATLATKEAMLNKLLPSFPRNVQFVGIDFNSQSLKDALSEAGFNRSLSSFIVWEGVTNYLSFDAVDFVIRYMGSLSPGSRLVFTYVHSGALDGSIEFEGSGKIVQDVAQLGEPWTFGLDPRQVPDFLQDRGLKLDRDLGARQYRKMYFGEKSEKMKGYDFYHVVSAHVP